MSSSSSCSSLLERTYSYEDAYEACSGCGGWDKGDEEDDDEEEEEEAGDWLRG